MVVPRIIVDLDARMLTVHRTDGRVVEVRLPEGVFAFETNIRGIDLDLAASRLVVTLPDRTAAVVEMDVDGRGDAAALEGRLTVYLDQNHWSAVSNARYDPEKVRDDHERAAAAELRAMVQAGRIVLPASSAHMTETTPMYGVPRQALATTILSLSRGWQMCNPIEVRRREIESACSGAGRAAVGVVTLEGDGVLASEEEPPLPLASDEVPELIRRLHPRIVSVLGLYDAIADAERIEPAGEQETNRWADAYNKLSGSLADVRATARQKQVCANVALMQDLQQEIVNVAGHYGGIPAMELWMNEEGAEFSTMPFLGRMEAVIYQRLLNVGDRWRANDLFDMHFLCCAAGYCDVVVGENKTIGYLRQVRGVTEGARLATTLAEGVDHVRVLLHECGV